MYNIPHLYNSIRLLWHLRNNPITLLLTDSDRNVF